MKTFLKISAIILLCISVIIFSLLLAYFLITKGAVLDANKLVGAGQNIIICDENGNEITDAVARKFKKRASRSANSTPIR